jgi:metallo-beta-lactamase family protein
MAFLEKTGRPSAVTSKTPPWDGRNSLSNPSSFLISAARPAARGSKFHSEQYSIRIRIVRPRFIPCGRAIRAAESVAHPSKCGRPAASVAARATAVWYDPVPSRGDRRTGSRGTARTGVRMGTITYLGGTGTVTGSKFLVEHDGYRVMVDCGLFQGLKDLRLRNWQPLPVDVAGIDLVVLTHAHLDHTGYLPVLVRGGFDRDVLATPATCELSGILLPDSGHLQEEDARFANWKGYSRHSPALPLYTEEEARRALPLLRPLPFDKTLEVHDGLSLRLYPAGHILGAALVEMVVRPSNGRGREKRLLFSGDLGRPDQPILPDPAPLPECDHLILESTYGGRDHPREDPKDRLESLIRDTVQRGGTLLIPSFAVGRTQTLLYLLREMREEDRLPEDIPVYLDSPMAIEATRIVTRHPEAQDLEMRALEAKGEDPLGLEGVRMASSVEESKALNGIAYPAIIISASGMAEGGRILHHLEFKLPDHRTTVLFVGFQAAGTRGRALQEGARSIKIHGKQVPVRARIETLDGLSAHADRGEVLRWLRSSGRRPGAVHLVHGEPAGIEDLAGRIRKELSCVVEAPGYLEKTRF